MVKPLQLPFTLNQDIPSDQFHLFKVCNAAHPNWMFKRHFYTFTKESILSAYGHQDGCDLQIIPRKCFSCDGTGIYKWRYQGDAYKEECNRCDNGIYTVDYVALQRYTLNGELFHSPIGRVAVRNGQLPDGTIPEYRNVIEGLIKHQPCELDATYAYMLLLKKTDLTTFIQVVTSYQERLMTNTKHRWRKIFQRGRPVEEALREYFEIETVGDESR